jgi:hypothetical protein
MATFYTYLWLRENGTPYYAGKGKGERAFSRSKRTYYPPPDKNRILMQEFPDEATAFEAEIFLISFYGRKDLGTGCLRNLTDGGEGSSGWVPSATTRDKMRTIRLGKPRPDVSEKLRGRPVSAETRQKISIARTGMSIPKLKGNTHYLRNIGRKNSAATLQKMTESAKRRWENAEARLLHSEKLKGRKFSVETRQKMSISARRRCEREALCA